MILSILVTCDEISTMPDDNAEVLRRIYAMADKHNMGMVTIEVHPCGCMVIRPATAEDVVDASMAVRATVAGPETVQ